MTPRTGTLYWLPRILDDESLDAVETLLMVALADHVNADDECFVGIKTLAKAARCSYGTARRRLAGLEARGVLTRQRRRREDGNLSTYLWSLVRPEPAPNLRASPAPTDARADQRASDSALTSARPEARAEPPSDEPPSGEPTQGALALVASGDADFDAFWNAYPKRNGKRLYKADAERDWRRMNRQERAEAAIAVHHYAAACLAGATLAKDPFRWLRGRCWVDWMEPADLTTQTMGKAMQGRAAMGNPAVGAFDIPRGNLRRDRG